MDAYYHNYYQNHCHPEKFTWFDTWQYPATVAHTIGTFVIPLQIYGGYCILFQTPQKIKTLKWPLFHLHLWTSLFDLGVTVFLTSVGFIPQSCQFSVGLLARMGVSPWIQMFGTQCFLGMVASAYVIIFENRHDVIVMDNWKIPNERCRWVFWIFNYLAGTVLMLPPYFLANEPDQDVVKLKMLEEYPCPAPDFFDPRLVLFYDDAIYYETFAQIQFATCISQAAYFTFHSVYYLLSTKVTISSRTRRLQLKVFKSICLQVSIPMTLLAFPVCYMIYCIHFKYYNQFLTNSLSVPASLHGVVSTVVLIMLYEPYRTYTKRQILKLFGRRMHMDPTPSQATSVTF